MTRRRVTRWWWGALAVIVGVTVAGCGLPGSGHVERIAPGDVPFGLLQTASPGATAPQPNGPRTSVYFVRAGNLVAAARRVVGNNVPAEAVRLLLVGPTRDEAAQGLTSDVPPGTRMVSLDLTRSVATVDLSAQFGAVGGSEQVLAVAQLVYTLTASKYIDAVAFAINGKRIEVPDGSGSLSSTPQRRGAYPHLLVPG